MMTDVLKGVSFRVRKGEFVAIMGPSGSGKSTLLNILGLLDQPDSGNYLIDGIDYARTDDETRSAARSRMIGFVFQQFHLLDRASALRNVTLPLLYSDTSSDGTARAERALEAVGLGHRKHYLPSELSGGEQQRVAIARALINDPPLILADEATGNLDAASGDGDPRHLPHARPRRAYVVLITHDKDVANHADRILSFSDGRMAGNEIGLRGARDAGAARRRCHDDRAGRRGNLARGLALSIQLLAAHRLRTALSVSGLLIGVAAVMVMAAIGRGAEQQLRERLQTMGTDLLVVSAAPAPRVAGRPRQVAVQTDLRADDAIALLEEIPAAAASAPAVNRNAVLRWEGRNRATGLSGTTAEGLRIRNIRAGSGRLFDDNDDREQQRVAVIGPAVARSLFAGVDPVGRTTRIGALEFEVIGVAAPRGIDPLGSDLDDFVAIPFQTAIRRVHNLNYVDAIYVQARSSDELDGLEGDVRAILSARLADRVRRFRSLCHPEPGHAAARRAGRGRRLESARSGGVRHRADARSHRHPHGHADLGARANTRDRSQARARRVAAEHPNAVRSRSRECSASRAVRRARSPVSPPPASLPISATGRSSSRGTRPRSARRAPSSSVSSSDLFRPRARHGWSRSRRYVRLKVRRGAAGRPAAACGDASPARRPRRCGSARAR